MMKTPVVLVAVALTVAILLTASLLIATGTRGEKGNAVIGEVRVRANAHASS
jgi:aldose sugar dehydrogenase